MLGCFLIIVHIKYWKGEIVVTPELYAFDLFKS